MIANVKPIKILGKSVIFDTELICTRFPVVKEFIIQRKAKITEYGVLCRIDEGMESLQEEEEFE